MKTRDWRTLSFLFLTCYISLAGCSNRSCPDENSAEWKKFAACVDDCKKLDDEYKRSTCPWVCGRMTTCPKEECTDSEAAAGDKLFDCIQCRAYIKNGLAKEGQSLHACVEERERESKKALDDSKSTR